MFSNYLGDKASPVTADGGLLHIQLGNKETSPFETEGVDIQNLGPLSSVAAAAISSGNAVNNQLYVQDSAITLKTEGKARQGWSASAVNVLCRQ